MWFNFKWLYDNYKRGGWPSSRYLEKDDALSATYKIVEELYSLNISSKKGVHLKNQINYNLLSSIARNIMTKVSFKKIINEVVSTTVSLTERTIYNYYEKLKIFLL